MLERTLRSIEKIIPKSLYQFFQPAYHYLLALAGAILYRFPSRELITIGVTGTKGKSTTAEIIYKILSEAGHKTALVNTIEFRIGNESERNYFKMTTPGRFFLQKFLRRALVEGSTHAVIEISSEAVLQYRHRFLYLDALIVTNLSPEHIERHGSYENYREAKLKITERIKNNRKLQKVLVLNNDDPESAHFRNSGIKNVHYFSLTDMKPYELTDMGTKFTWQDMSATSNLIGEFNLQNIAGVLNLTQALGISKKDALSAIEKFQGSRGRVEKIELGPQDQGGGKQNFTVIVDYAHTADSMEKLYKAFPGHRKICVFGATGGGRDKWKRPEMGKVASQYCDTIILTDDDSYDEDTRAIIADIEKGIANQKKEVILDRREAIRAGLKSATKDSVVLITGKGTDPFLMGPNNKKTPWSDADIAREELEKLITSNK
ncbi:MAG: UDP-N-acetylmuramoyl-L-alanyl-D-glutamate--2,6-diaminopimelate ligase [bacterium]|nr:UDP-N-acetylmuramoyl-L-alanyl-D-glutamate--2,6-diaminopimelate ligase [bacterium]